METTYPTLRGKIRASKSDKAARDARFAALFAEATAAGRAAAEACTPTPMTVVDQSTGQRWTVVEGACGFAWVVVRPGNSAFARWLVATKRAHKHWGGGVEIWISDYGQSVEYKEAHANAMARALRAADINAYAGSSLD